MAGLSYKFSITIPNVLSKAWRLYRTAQYMNKSKGKKKAMREIDSSHGKPFQMCNYELKSESPWVRYIKSYKWNYIYAYLANELSVEPKEILQRMNKSQTKFVNKSETIRALWYLKKMNFDNITILESISIMSYTVEDIIEGLQKVYENEAELKSYGFNNGFIDKETKMFETHTSSKDKRLQLCIYYIQNNTVPENSEILF